MLIFFIITIILILLLHSQLKLSVHNIENINYVKVCFLCFTIDLDYTRFMKTIRRLGLENDIDLREEINIYKTINPMFREIVKQTVIENANFYKFFDEYSNTYKVITFYLISSYLNVFLANNCKMLKNYSCDICYSNERTDMDFKFVCKIKIFSIFYAIIKNIKVLFKYFKRRIVHGS